MNFEICSSTSRNDLKTLVSQFMDDGWLPAGGLVVVKKDATDGEYEYLQAIYKPKETE